MSILGPEHLSRTDSGPYSPIPPQATWGHGKSRCGDAARRDADSGGAGTLSGLAPQAAVTFPMTGLCILRSGNTVAADEWDPSADGNRACVTSRDRLIARGHMTRRRVRRRPQTAFEIRPWDDHSVTRPLDRRRTQPGDRLDPNWRQRPCPTAARAWQLGVSVPSGSNRPRRPPVVPHHPRGGLSPLMTRAEWARSPEAGTGERGEHAGGDGTQRGGRCPHPRGCGHRPAAGCGATSGRRPG